jgi:hypothetical protein
MAEQRFIRPPLRTEITELSFALTVHDVKPDRLLEKPLLDRREQLVAAFARWCGSFGRHALGTAARLF